MGPVVPGDFCAPQSYAPQEERVPAGLDLEREAPSRPPPNPCAGARPHPPDDRASSIPACSNASWPREIDSTPVRRDSSCAISASLWLRRLGRDARPVAQSSTLCPVASLSPNSGTNRLVFEPSRGTRNWLTKQPHFGVRGLKAPALRGSASSGRVRPAAPAIHRNQSTVRGAGTERRARNGFQKRNPGISRRRWSPPSSSSPSRS